MKIRSFSLAGVAGLLMMVTASGFPIRADDLPPPNPPDPCTNFAKAYNTLCPKYVKLDCDPNGVQVDPWGNRKCDPIEEVAAVYSSNFGCMPFTPQVGDFAICVDDRNVVTNPDGSQSSSPVLDDCAEVYTCSPVRQPDMTFKCVSAILGFFERYQKKVTVPCTPS